MGSHPINLAIRFLLEIMALVSVGMWGWKQHEGWFRWLLTIGFPILLAITWVTFAVPNDPSRSGSAPIVTPGVVRLALELGIFAFAAWALNNIGLTKSSWIFGSIVVLHYVASYDRIMWLISQ